MKRRRWRILEPVEITRVLRAFEDEQARTMFLTLVLTGLRRFELLGLRWRDVDLVESVLRVRESKSEEGERSIALSPTLVAALVEHLERTPFKGAGELVFCHQKRGSKIDHEWYATKFRKALAAVGITDYVRPAASRALCSAEMTLVENSSAASVILPRNSAPRSWEIRSIVPARPLATATRIVTQIGVCPTGYKVVPASRDLSRPQRTGRGSTSRNPALSICPARSAGCNAAPRPVA